MLPLLENAAPDARVITVSSGGMYTAPLTTDLQVTFVVKFFTVIFAAGWILMELTTNFSQCSLAKENSTVLNSMLETSEFRFVIFAC